MPGKQKLRVTTSGTSSFYSLIPSLPWSLPLKDWPNDLLAALPRGISRHVVRFIKAGGAIFAVKEIPEEDALHEYQMLRELHKKELPSVSVAAVVAGRVEENGEELSAALITHHLKYSLPYRVLLSKHLSRDNLERVLDSLVVLLVRLHLNGFYWGDVSLSNTLFRRDAGIYAAYLVDAETGRFYDNLSDRSREYDVSLGAMNIIGELMDLQAGGLVNADIDVTAIGDYLEQRYQDLWNDLTGSERIPADEIWRVGARAERLGQLGFDIGQVDIESDEDGDFLRFQPRVVEAGHFQRRVKDLTGLEVQEEQAKRIYTDILTYQRRKKLEKIPLRLVANTWMDRIYLPTISAIPDDLQAKLQPAQIFHEVLEHRWFMSEKAGHHVHTRKAVKDYIRTQLAARPDEQVVLPMPLTAPVDPAGFMDSE